MLPPEKKYTIGFNSPHKWITIGLVSLLVASLAFMGWAIYDSRKGPAAAPAVTVADEPLPPPPPPPPPKYNCPLDGTEYADKASTINRPIVVQIDNAPAARPQSGLSHADIVYEAMAEGQVTRFSAIFMCREASVVGPVRSARLITLELVPGYTALLANSGASSGVTAELQNRPDIPNINHGGYPDAYWRTSDRDAPHNLMTSTAGIRQAAAGAGLPVQVEISGPVFKNVSPGVAAATGATAVKTISVSYSAWVDVSYQYDPGTNSWLRFMGGSPHIDTLTSTQLAPRNVIIQYVPVSESSIVEDTGGNLGLTFGLTGTGKALIFRDGQVINAHWKRTATGDVTTYVDSGGRPVPLNVGQTFIQLVPPDFQATWG